MVLYLSGILIMLIGRKKEIQVLKKISKSSKAELVVLYGRRRIGKTFLIREFFSQQNCLFFQATGLQNGVLKKQLHNFADAMSQIFTHGIQINTPASWSDCFRTLNQFIESTNDNRQTVIFMDEVPWMATRKSGFLEALDYYWNHYWSARSNFVLVICGSSASWLIKNIIYNKGGLHNRCTCEIKLDPFDLEETQEYLLSRSIKFSKRYILELYMALGGIPYYLNYVEKGRSIAENIQNIFFDKKAPLKEEFTKLFNSLFNEAGAYIELIELISQKKEGLSRAEIESLSKLSPGGGRLTERLDDLERTNFIEAHMPWDKQRGEYFKVIDEFSLFYIYWISSKKTKTLPEDYWLKQIEKPIYNVWAGYAFEAVCYKHIDKIIKALNIKTAENISSWRLVSRKDEIQGAQIVLLIDRSDDAVTICEIKYTDKIFTINKSYAENLRRKIKVFMERTQTKKQVFLAIVSANGLKKNSYADELVTNEITLDDLF
jgi:AAA+ ATPase superfamily predicted ATPase